MLPNNKFNEFRDDVVSMLDGLVRLDVKNDHADNFHVAKLVGSAVADSIVEAFKPVGGAVIGSTITFQNNIDESHPLATQQGRQEAHNKIFDNLAEIVMDESGRLGKCLDSVSESTGKTRDEVKAAIKSQVSDLRTEFGNKATYSEKNQVILQLRGFYDAIRNHDKLETIVNENYSSMRPR